MAVLDEVILLDQIEEVSFELIPPGWYEATITATELKDTKDGSGKYIKVRYDIAGPTHAGRCVFGNLNIRNSSAKAEEIGRGQLAALCRCIGITDTLQDTDQLVGGGVQVKLAIRSDKSGQYEDQNEIKAFKPLGELVPAGGGSAAPSVPSAPKSSPKPAAFGAPWKK